MTKSNGYAWLIQSLNALELCHTPISRENVFPLLKACGERNDIDLVRRIQSCIVKGRLDGIAVLGDHLIRMFASCGSLLEANNVFSKVKDPSMYTWSSIILANAKLGDGQNALSLYHKMQLSNVENNRCIFLAGLKACVVASSYTEGMLIHYQIVQSGVGVDAMIGSTLIDMYGKCGFMEEAHIVFDKLSNPNRVCWNALIVGYTLHCDCFPALELFEKMQHSGIEPDNVTFSSICKACGSIRAVKHGQIIHNQILRRNVECDKFVGGSLVDMYSKCGNIDEARKVFDTLPNRDAVVWHTMIAGYAVHECIAPALELFGESQQEGSFPSILKACAGTGAIVKGRLIHNQIMKTHIDLDVVVGSALVDMYAKCGNLDEAGKVFDGLPVRNVVSWGALIAGYARAGNYLLAWECLDRMQREGLKPNDMIFSSLLAVSSKIGVHAIFKLMGEHHGSIPTAEHHVCMVDLLSRSGHLKEAEDLLHKTQSNVFGWMSLLSACKLHGKVEMGRRCFEQVVHLDRDLPAAYESMYDIYIKACMWEEAAHIQKMRQHTNVWKKPGRAWIEVDQKVHEFVVRKSNYLEVDELYSKQKNLRKQLEEQGYKPQLESLLQPILKGKGAMQHKDSTK